MAAAAALWHARDRRRDTGKAASANPVLDIQGLSKTYADGTEALSRIDLSVAAGEIVALIGGSGCGKTTLLRLIAGLDRASAGAIRLDGEAIAAPHPGVGLVFQEPRLLPWLSVADNVGFGLDRIAAPARRARVAHALERVGLAEHAATLAARPVGRAAAARLDRPRLRRRPAGAAARRAVLGARRLHPQGSARAPSRRSGRRRARRSSSSPTMSGKRWRSPTAPW